MVSDSKIAGKSYTLQELADRIGAECCGDGTRSIVGLSELGDVMSDRLSLTETRKLAEALPIEIPLVAEGKNFPDGREGLKVQSFRKAMCELLALFEPHYTFEPSRSPLAWVHPDAQIAASAYIGPNCTVSAGAVIGENVHLIANVYVGPDAEIGEDSVLEPMVTVQRRTKIGARCLIHSSAVLGADGFGFIPGGPAGVTLKVPQIGRVILGDDVEIGACTCVDRATIGDTVIGSGTKIDNQVQIGHNCHLGKNCIMSGQSGLAGSAILGDSVIMGARSGALGHIHVGSGTQIGGMSFVMKDTPGGKMLTGFPASDHKEDFRLRAAQRRVPEMLKRIKELEQKLEILSQKMAQSNEQISEGTSDAS